VTQIAVREDGTQGRGRLEDHATAPALAPALAPQPAPWRSVAAVAAFLAMIGLAVWLAWIEPEEGSEALSIAGTWLVGLQSFFAEFYQSLDIQLLLAMCAVGVLLERLIPARRQALSNYAFNIPYSAMILIFVGAIIPLQVAFADLLVDQIGWRNIFGLNLEPGESIPLAILGMAITALAIDFFFYWFHRCQHSSEILWQAHMLHHSDMTLNVTTTHRVHFVEHLLTPIFMIAPIMVFVDLPPKDIYWIAILPSMWSYFVHANVRIGFGKLWWLLSSPQYHRIHHSIRPEHRNKNFAVWFPFYDAMFGTAYAPKPGEYPETGVAGVTVATMSDAFMLPFTRWWAMTKEMMRALSSQAR
jgi:sterol desaturase/sphingolipid hydroxylase (fatty acid hydroxylase superfamily)